mgnify:CR=1 FL=1
MIDIFRRGVNGLGHCNHVGGILFAIEDFCRRRLKEHEEPVSCTSRLCSWNAPKNVQVDPKPVDNIVITKCRFGKEKETDKCAKVNKFDPRAPADRGVIIIIMIITLIVKSSKGFS